MNENNRIADLKNTKLRAYENLAFYCQFLENDEFAKEKDFKNVVEIMGILGKESTTQGVLKTCSRIGNLIVSYMPL